MWLKFSGWSGKFGIPSTRGQRRQVADGLTSLNAKWAKPEKLLGLRRQYWEIESGLHYRRDVTLHEDDTRSTIEKAGHAMAILNNLLIGLCLRAGYGNLAKARRLFAAKPERAFALILAAPVSFL